MTLPKPNLVRKKARLIYIYPGPPGKYTLRCYMYMWTHRFAWHQTSFWSFWSKCILHGCSMYPYDITSPFSPEKVHFKKRCFAIYNQGLFFTLINIICGGILLSVDVNLERPRRVLKRKASSARPSKRRSLTLFNQICNLQNSSTPFFHKHHLELGTGGFHPKHTQYNLRQVAAIL